MEVFLAPQNFAGQAILDQQAYNYVNQEHPFGFLVDLPAVPRKDEEIEFEAFSEEAMYKQLLDDYKSDSDGIRWIIRNARSGICIDGICYFTADELEGLSDEEVLREMCKHDDPRTATFYEGVWFVERVQWLPDLNYVFVCIKQKLF